MVSLSKRNKRTSLHQKYKVEKKVKQHNKKQKKASKNVKPKKQLPASQQIPMEHPRRNEIIKEIELNELKEKIAEKKRLLQAKNIKKPEKIDELQKLKNKLPEHSPKTAIEEIKKVMDKSHVIMCVLDARDPMGTRSLEYENLIKSENKTFIFILNKIDLVPLEYIKSWCAYLSEVAPVFPFKASSELSNENIPKNIKIPTKCYGNSDVVNYLNSFADDSSNKQVIVGVIGSPNTGKSSIINSLRKKKKVPCEVGCEPGVTKKMSHHQISKNLVLFDTPGFVLQNVTDNNISYALRNFVPINKIINKDLVVKEIYRMCTPNHFRDTYYIYRKTFDEFWSEFSTKYIQVKKGVIRNMELAKVKLINDWNQGKLKHHTRAPVTESEKTVQFEDLIKYFTLSKLNSITSQDALEMSEPVKAIIMTEHVE